MNVFLILQIYLLACIFGALYWDKLFNVKIQVINMLLIFFVYLIIPSLTFSSSELNMNNMDYMMLIPMGLINLLIYLVAINLIKLIKSNGCN